MTLIGLEPYWNSLHRWKKKKKTFRSSTCTKRWNTVFKWFVGRLGVGPASWVSLENTATEAKNNIFKPLPFFLLILWHRYWIITDACKLCFSAGSVWGKKPTCTSYHVLSYKTCVRYKIHWCVVLKAPLWEMLCKKSILFWRGIGLGERDHISQNWIRLFALHMWNYLFFSSDDHQYV